MGPIYENVERYPRELSYGGVIEDMIKWAGHCHSVLLGEER